MICLGALCTSLYWLFFVSPLPLRYVLIAGQEFAYLYGKYSAFLYFLLSGVRGTGHHHSQSSFLRLLYYNCSPLRRGGWEA